MSTRHGAAHAIACTVSVLQISERPGAAGMADQLGQLYNPAGLTNSAYCKLEPELELGLEALQQIS